MNSSWLKLSSVIGNFYSSIYGTVRSCPSFAVLLSVVVIVVLIWQRTMLYSFLSWCDDKLRNTNKSIGLVGIAPDFVACANYYSLAKALLYLAFAVLMAFLSFKCIKMFIMLIWLMFKAA